MTPFTAPSHSSFFKPVVRELASRGHSITYWSGLKPPPPGSRDQQNSSSPDNGGSIRILFSEQLSGRYNFDQHGINWSTVDHPFELLFTLSDRLAQTCSAMYRDPVFLHLKNSSMNQYALIVVDAVRTPFFFFFIHSFIHRCCCRFDLIFFLSLFRLVVVFLSVDPFSLFLG